MKTQVKLTDEILTSLREKAHLDREDYPDLEDDQLVELWAPVLCMELAALLDAYDELRRMYRPESP